MTPTQGRPLLLYLITNELSSSFLRGQLAHMIADGYSVVVATCYESPEAASRFDEGVTLVDLPFAREPKALQDMRALLSAVRLVRKVKPALVNASTPKAGLIGMVAAWVCRVPARVYVVRGFRFETATGWRRRLYRALEHLAVRCATHVIFNSTSLRALGEREGVVRPGAGDVLGAGSGNGVDVARFADLPDRLDARRSLGLEEHHQVVGFVGRLTRDKGAADLVRVFQKLKQDRPSLRLLLLGAHEDGDPLDAATRIAIKEDRAIINLGWCDRPGIAYRAMDVLAFPSYREGMPNVPLEAQLCGLPVVAYAATGTVDAVQDGVTAILVPVGDQSGFAEAVVALLDDPERRSRMGEAGRTWVRCEFSQTRIWTELARRYDIWAARGTASSAGPPPPAPHRWIG